MRSDELQVTDGALTCPGCAGIYVHLDDAFVAGRADEDGQVSAVHVDSAGNITSGPAVTLPISDVGRRHVFALTGWCEQCSVTFAIEFVQHKGQTLLRVQPLS